MKQLVGLFLEPIGILKDQNQMMSYQLSLSYHQIIMYHDPPHTIRKIKALTWKPPLPRPPRPSYPPEKIIIIIIIIIINLY